MSVNHEQVVAKYATAVIEGEMSPSEAAAELITNCPAVIKYLAGRIYPKFAANRTIEFRDVEQTVCISIYNVFEKYKDTSATMRNKNNYLITSVYFNSMRSLNEQYADSGVKISLRKKQKLLKKDPYACRASSVEFFSAGGTNLDSREGTIYTPDSLIDHQDSPEDKVIKDETFAEMLQAMQYLTDKQKEIIYMLYFQDDGKHTVRQVAEEMGVSKSLVSLRAKSAIKVLKEYMPMSAITMDDIFK